MTSDHASTPVVSVILVTYNAWDYTRRCLDHLLQEPCNVALEVIVIDNASSDGSVAKIRETFASVKVIEAGDNLGFGRACNTAMTHARGEFAALVNNDALLSSEQLAEMLRAYRQHNLNGIYTARIIDENGNDEASCFRDTSPDALLRSAFTLMSSALRKATYALAQLQDDALEIDSCSGAFLLFPRKAWEHVGGFDENFFMYYEDIDLCRRFRALGYHCYVNTRVKIEHACGGSAGDYLQRGAMVDTSQRYFYRKHYGRAGAVKARIYQVIRSAPRTVVHGMLAFSPAHRREFRLHFRQLRCALSDT